MARYRAYYTIVCSKYIGSIWREIERGSVNIICNHTLNLNKLTSDPTIQSTRRLLLPELITDKTTR